MSLLYLAPSQAKDKFFKPLKHKLAQKVHAQLYSTCLFSSIIITQYQHVREVNYTYYLIQKYKNLKKIAFNFSG